MPSFKMDLAKLLLYSGPRFKYWDWTELYSLTGKTPNEIKKEVLEINKTHFRVDPSFVLTQSYKNHNKKYQELALDKYNCPDMFDIVVSDYGVSQKFVLHSKTPIWASYIYDNDWYWKQKWLAKYKSIFLVIPFVKNIYLSCSVASCISNSQSDIDLLILVKKNTVWFVKIYFAIVSKILKYYNFPFAKGLYLWLKKDYKALQNLKDMTLENKIKIDFGMVFETWQDVDFTYREKERYFFIWNNIDVKNDLSYFEPPLSKIISCTLFVVFWLILPICLVFGYQNYRWQKKYNSNNANMIVRWNMYSQYNIIF